MNVNIGLFTLLRDNGEIYAGRALGDSDILRQRFQEWIQRYFNFSNISFEQDPADEVIDLVSPQNSPELLKQDTRSSAKTGIKLPLYFQHDGHSRTIIGYEVTRRNSHQPKKARTAKPASSSGSEFKLLVFDPASDGKMILANLTDGNGNWKRQLKRGIHTLTKSAYQIMYIAGTLSPEARELSKIVDSVSDKQTIRQYFG